jgi:hypothetical protein
VCNTGICLGDICCARPAVLVGADEDDEEAIVVVLDPVGGKLTYSIRL